MRPPISVIEECECELSNGESTGQRSYSTQYRYVRRKYWCTVSLLSVTCAAFTLLISAVLAYISYNYYIRDQIEICASPGCIHITSQMLHSMNTTANPCENFYEYACGNWQREAPSWTPHYHQIFDTGITLWGEMVPKLVKANTDLSPAQRNATSFLQSCMDAAAMKVRGIKPFIKVFSSLKTVTRTPLYEEYLKVQHKILKHNRTRRGVNIVDLIIQKYDLQLKYQTEIVTQSLIKAFNNGLYPLFWIGTKLNYTEGTEVEPMFILVISPPELYLKVMVHEDETKTPFTQPRHNPMNSTIYGDATKLMDNVGSSMKALLLEMGFNANTSATMVDNFVEMEFELAQITQPIQLSATPHCLQYLTVPELQYTFPMIDWRLLIDATIHTRVTDEEEICLSDVRFLYGLNALMRQYFEDDVPNLNGDINDPQFFGARRFSSYIKLRTTASLIGMAYSPDIFPPSIQPFMRDLHVMTMGHSMFLQMDRGHSCLLRMMHLMPVPLISAYVQITRPQTIRARNITYEIFNHIVDTVQLAVMVSDLTFEDKKVTYEKLEHMIAILSFGDLVLNVTKLDDMYSTMSTTPRDYVSNIVEAMTVSSVIADDRLHTLPKRHELIDTRFDTPNNVIMPNAKYSYTANRVIIPLSLLNPPLLTLDTPSSRVAALGSIGTIIGHELMHSFDTKGIYYDTKMLNKRLEWMSDKMQTEYDAMVGCFEEEFGHYIVNGVKINGTKTVDENFADILGLRWTYRTYKSLNEQRQYYHGLNVTDEQLFFLAFAQTWCSQTGSSQTAKQIDADVHSPEKFRVLGSLRMLDEFSDAYKCPVGSYMNPARKCPKLFDS